MSRVALLCASVLAVACESAPARVHQPSAAALEIAQSSGPPPSRAESLIASRAKHKGDLLVVQHRYLKGRAWHLRRVRRRGRAKRQAAA